MKFNNSFFPYTTILWNNLPNNVKSKDLTDFKLFIKTEFKPPRFKHFSRGNKHANSLLTKLRVGRSDLNLHKFTIGIIDSPLCDCHFREESTSHYFVDCFLYTHERQILFGLFEHFIPKFNSFTKPGLFIRHKDNIRKDSLSFFIHHLDQIILHKYEIDS